MKGERDPGLDALLGLDGEVFCHAGAASAERPHGLSYSLTLHDEKGERPVGFDNAHTPPEKKGRGRPVERDHRHRLGTVRPYEYRDAATLLDDFWAEVAAILKERGGQP